MEELLNKALEGDKNSFSLIFLELQKDMYKIALSKTGNNQEISRKKSGKTRDISRITFIVL